MRLSSPGTTFYKVILPAILLILFGMTAVDSLRGNQPLGDLPEDFPLPPAAVLPALMGLGVLHFYWAHRPLKHVSLGPTSLKVSGLAQEIEIPLADIERVRGSMLLYPEVITLELRRPSAFGRRIRFMPSIRRFPLSTHPTITLLRERLAALAK